MLINFLALSEHRFAKNKTSMREYLTSIFVQEKKTERINCKARRGYSVNPSATLGAKR